MVPRFVLHVAAHKRHDYEGLVKLLRESVGLRELRCDLSVAGLTPPKYLPSQLSRKCCSLVRNQDSRHVVMENDWFYDELCKFQGCPEWEGFHLGIFCDVICRDDNPPISLLRLGEWPR